MLKNVDILLLDELFSDEQLAIRDVARNFVADEYLPIVSEYFRKAEFPMQIIPKLGELGFLGAVLPEQYGGAEIDYIGYGLMNTELEYGDSGLRSLISVQNGLVIYPIFTYGSEEQRQNWLPKLCSGEAIGCYGLTEPDYGSNPGGMITTAKESDNGYILNGNKMWITNGSIADVAVVWAKLNGEVRGFLVEKDRPGYSTTLTTGKYSLRASVTSELHFQDCEIPKTNILPKAFGLKAPLSCLSQARYGISFGAIGAAMACYDEVVRYSKERIQFDRPIGGFQIIQEKLVKMLNEITKGFLVAWRVGQLMDQGKCKHYHISFAKRNNVEAALNITRDARAILGANGITDEYSTIRHMLNLESVYTYEGTHDIHTLIVGKEITGLDAVTS
jgi:glutaryl-CoA dehydrogenase